MSSFTELFTFFGLWPLFAVVLVVAGLGAYKLVKEWFPW